MLAASAGLSRGRLFLYNHINGRGERLFTISFWKNVFGCEKGDKVGEK